MNLNSYKCIMLFSTIFWVFFSVEGEYNTGLPVWFEENIGQINDHTKFIYRGTYYTLSAYEDNIGITTHRDKTVYLKFLENISSPHIKARSPHSGKVHILKGTNPNNWFKNIPLYKKIYYENLFSGIDFVLHGEHHTLKLDFVLQPYADWALIRFKILGADELSIDDRGNLILQLENENIIIKAPIAYQETALKPKTIPCEFVIHSSNEISFRIGEYDCSQKLFIDPELSFSTYLIETSSARGVGVDKEGNVYVGGFTNSPSFPAQNAYQAKHKGNLDIFVLKLDPSLENVLYATYIGGQNDDDIKAMAVDEKGYVYLGGRTKSDDFPTTENAIFRKRVATYDNIIAKLSPTGDELIYSTLLGGKSMEEIRGIAFDPEGNCAVVGGTHSTDFPTTSTSFQPTYTDPPEPDPEKKSGKPFIAEDAFVAKINSTGTALIFCSFLGGRGYDKAWGCAMDKNGCVYVTGYTGSKNFPITENAFQSSHGGGDPSGDFGELDVFITKFSPDGSKLIFSSYLGGNGNDKGESVKIDPEGNIYVAGDTSSTNFPVINAFQSQYGGGKSDGFITKISPNGEKLMWSTFIGGSEEDLFASHAMCVDNSNNIHVAGLTNSYDFPIHNPIQRELKGPRDATIITFDKNGKLLFSSFLGGLNNEEASAITSDLENNIYVVGGTQSADFPLVKPLFSGQTSGVFFTKVSLRHLTKE